MKLEVSIWLGVLLSSPLWMYEFWAFVGPGMTRKEKAYTWAYGTAGLFLFLAGPRPGGAPRGFASMIYTTSSFTANCTLISPTVLSAKAIL